jgi:hypothetical protein
MDSNDLLPGTQWMYVCNETRKSHFIISHKEVPGMNKLSAVRSDDGSMCLYGATNCAVQKRNYFFYSPPGYETADLALGLSRDHNACYVNDVNDFSDVRADAQFLIIEDYAPNNRLSMTQIRSMTSGTSWGSNPKSHGRPFRPRNDVQLVILSNHHLFYCMGKGKERKISSIDAEALRNRFHIIKLDEGVAGAGTELRDAARYVAPAEED